MPKVLQLAPDLVLPLDACTRRLAILAMSGAGKSNVAVVMAEQMFDAGIPWVAIDPKGDWWGVRSSKSGKGPGLPIPIFGGLHGDVPLEPTAGKLIGEMLVEQRLTCVLDVSEFEERQGMWAFLADLGATLLRRNRQVLHLFLEECDEYLPQKPGDRGNLLRCLGIWQRVVKRGRFRGLGTTQITQRNAALNKDTLYQAEALIAMRVTGKGDRDAIKGWVDHHNAAAEIVTSLPSLADGEGWMSSPAWLRETKRVRFARRRTFDSGGTPVLLEGNAPPATLADVDLDQLRTRMAATIEKAKADDPTELRRRIAALERELATARRQPTPLARVETKVETKLERVEVPILTDEHLRQFRAGCLVLKEIFDETRGLAEQLVAARSDLGKTTHQIEVVVAQATGPGSPARRPLPAPVQTAAPRAARPAPRAAAPPPVDGEFVIGKVEQKILDALAELAAIGIAPAERVQVAFFSGYTNVKSGGFSEPVGRLTTAGLVASPRPGWLQLTTAGESSAQPVAIAPTSEALQSRILTQLDGPRRKLLRALLEIYPAPISKAALSEQVGYTNVKSGGFSEPMGSLVTLGFAESPAPGHVRASPRCFLNGGPA